MRRGNREKISYSRKTRNRGEGIVCNGSITVEAAFVMPVVLLAVFALIYLTLQLHDTCRIQGVLDKTLHQAGISYKHKAELASGKVNYAWIGGRGVFYGLLGDRSSEEGELTAYLQQELSEGLFLSRITGLETKVGRTKLRIRIEAETPISLPWIASFFTGFSTTVISGEYPVHNPAETIRLCEIVLDTGSQIKGVELLKSKLENFLKK